MAIHTQQSLSGFIASDPQLTHTESGKARFYAKVGQEHYRREQDGSFTQLETTFHDLVAFNRTAERSHERFKKGDSFVAEGYTHEYPHERDGQQVQDEEFVAKKIGYDTARTNYQVDRTPRRAAAERNVTAFESPERRPRPETPAVSL